MGAPAELPQTPVVRSTRSRAALISAAQDFLAKGRFDFKMQEVATRAEVALQTVYNHFPTRDALATAAAEAAMDEFEEYLFECDRSAGDLLEQFALNMRLFARMPDTHPRIAAIVVNTPVRSHVGPRGYTQAALKHATALVERGLAQPENLDIALMTAVASTERLMMLRTLDPTRSAAEVEDLVLQNLMTFGVSRERAKELVSLPLPPRPAAD